MKFSVLTSGSKANSTYLESSCSKLLIDCGLSAKQIALRLQSIGVDPNSLDGILVTHEHGDHVRGVSVMSRRHGIPVYATPGIEERLGDVHELRCFESGQVFDIGELSINPIPLVHDAHDPVGFVFENSESKFVQLTDTGKITEPIREAVRGCNGIVLESNHDPELLQICEYPWELKQRIASSHGHLSNLEAAKFITEIMHTGLEYVVLGHLSENSNTPETAIRTFEDIAPVEQLVGLYCAGLLEPTPLFELRSQRIEDSVEESTAVNVAA